MYHYFKFSLDMQIQNDGTPNELLKLITDMAPEGSFLLHFGFMYIIEVKYCTLSNHPCS